MPDPATAPPSTRLPLTRAVQLPSRTPLLITCRACDHVWPMVWLPANDMAVVAATNPTICPSCGTTDGELLVFATRDDGDLDRYVVQLETELMRAKADLVAYPPQSQ
jgi:hypothetical protein